MPGESSGRKAVQAVITGTVQGVWFRAWTVEQASARGLDGWVRNRRDGSVEAVFAGDAALVDDMIKICHRGPSAANVAQVAVTPAADMPAAGFRKLPTA
ncbi:MAG: acylphosphatase [Rhodospirillaceae bacterium]|jgi:acylphosphatase|nr:acylphosphatase [Rhodospirillaceae bacterium]